MDLYVKITRPRKERGELDLATMQNVEDIPLKVNPEETAKFVGAHLSIADGLDKIYGKTKAIGGRAVALFLKNQRTLRSKPLDEKVAARFVENMAEIRPYILPHASYLINLANPDGAKGAMSMENLLEELRRCEALKISGCNLHPGSNVGKLPVRKACELIAARINAVLSKTRTAAIIIENMAGQGNVIGSAFSELRMILDGVEDKSRVGVCLDTCHLFGAGYDIRTAESFEKVMVQFDAEVGMKYLRGMHLNDSKMPFGSRKDRHESIGAGLIGMEAFRYIMNSPRFDNIPMVLETPNPSNYAREIRLLYSLIKD